MTRKKSIGVITAIFGNYDKIPPVPKGFDKAILVSDSLIDSGWQNRVLKTSLPSNFSAKIPKFRPDLFIDTDSSVWIDANLRDPENWLSDVSRNLLNECDLALFRHPSRNTVSDEIKASSTKFKYKGIDFSIQIQKYREEGFADNKGLWAGGVIARNHTSKNAFLGNEWLLQNIIWNTQDQISLPYILYRLNIAPNEYPDDLHKGKINFIGHSTNWTTRKRDMIHVVKLIRSGEFNTSSKFVIDILKSRLKKFSL